MTLINLAGDTNNSSGGGTSYDATNRLNAAFIGDGTVTNSDFGKINQVAYNTWTTSRINTGVYKVTFDDPPSVYTVFLAPKMSRFNPGQVAIVVAHVYDKFFSNFRVRCRATNANDEYGTLVDNEFDFLILVNGKVHCSGTVNSDGTKA